MRTKAVGNKKEKESSNTMQHMKKPKDVHRGPSFTHYTPLNTNRAHLLKEALNVNLIPTPGKNPTLNNDDDSKHYRYHRNYGHNTDECIPLRDKIEQLTQVGYLKCFVQRKEGQRVLRERSQEPREEDTKIMKNEKIKM